MYRSMISIKMGNGSITSRSTNRGHLLVLTGVPLEGAQQDIRERAKAF